MQKFPMLRMRPVMLSLIVMVLLALAWLPTGEYLPGDRTEKPQLYVSYQEQHESQFTADVQFDVQQRIESRHEWLLVDEPVDYAWTVEISVAEQDQVVLNGQLLTPKNAEGVVEQQKFRIQGPKEVAGALPERFVKVLVDLIEKAESAEQSL
ncbi:hypothetical protein [Pseudidiomarina sediminum]|uniref:hypothetical protein n=1 Tax=Pseudidiomarina sediminum TaxID=431675 RepID=UPI001C96EE01|nr:hypothetical protein [Pseudidiomarina sediminum]MBY6064690.1 hypothetical protein [Pseudidiomarina sediminum]